MFLSQNLFKKLSFNLGEGITFDIDLSSGWGEACETFLKIALELSGLDEEKKEAIRQVIVCENPVYEIVKREGK